MFLRRSPRACRRLIAVTVLLLAAFGTVPFVMPHVDPGGDAGHAAAFVPHDASAHQIGAAGWSDLHQHCAVCHLVRTSCSPSHAGVAVRASLVRADRISTPFVLPTSLRHWSTGPERAPPA